MYWRTRPERRKFQSGCIRAGCVKMSSSVCKNCGLCYVILILAVREHNMRDVRINCERVVWSLFNSILCRKIRVISQMYFIRARIMIFPHTYTYIYIFFSTKLFWWKNHAAVTSNRFWFGTKWGLGFYRHPCNKIEKIITRDTRVCISARGNAPLHSSCRVGVGSITIVFGSSAKTCSRASRRELLFLPYFFLIVDLPSVIPLRGHESPIYDSSNVLIHFTTPATVDSISRAMRVSTIYIAVTRERYRWRRDWFRLSGLCVGMYNVRIWMCVIERKESARQLIDSNPKLSCASAVPM